MADLLTRRTEFAARVFHVDAGYYRRMATFMACLTAAFALLAAILAERDASLAWTLPGGLACMAMGAALTAYHHARAARRFAAVLDGEQAAPVSDQPFPLESGAAFYTQAESHALH